MSPASLSKAQACAHWIRAQGLDRKTPFGEGPQATPAAIEHLGYVQIDTIHVIERCHHHILYNRIPTYRREHLHRSQALDKNVFEYWTHALSYVPARDFRYFLADMVETRRSPNRWMATVKPEELRKVLRLIKQQGAVSIRDINDDVLVEKDHPWASRKPSKRALQMGFYTGRLVVSERQGMLKKYELTERHFGWDKKPKAATEREILDYLLDRSLRAQALVSVDSICYLDAPRKAAIRSLIEKRVKAKRLIPVAVAGIESTDFWAKPEELETQASLASPSIHILSPFDPLIIQRKRLHAFFDYEHIFEAYVPPAKRVFGYFALPVLMDGRIVANLDLKTDRERGRLLVQKWNWIGRSKSRENKARIEVELDRFEDFQLGR